MERLAAPLFCQPGSGSIRKYRADLVSISSQDQREQKQTDSRQGMTKNAGNQGRANQHGTQAVFDIHFKPFLISIRLPPENIDPPLT